MDTFTTYAQPEHNKTINRPNTSWRIFLGYTEPIDPTRALKVLTKGAVGKVEVAGPAGAQTYYPAEDVADVFSHLLLSVLRLGPYQWYWVAADATATLDWSLMIPAKPPNPM